MHLDTMGSIDKYKSIEAYKYMDIYVYVYTSVKINMNPVHYNSFFSLAIRAAFFSALFLMSLCM